MKNPFSLTGKNILITGASSGIGKATALLCAEMGAQVWITGRNKERLNEVFLQLAGENHQQIVADLTTEEGLDTIVDFTDQLDGVVFSAGITKPTPIRFIKPKHEKEIFDINYRSPLFLSAKLLKKKKINPKGSLVFLSSFAADYAYIGGALYSSSKSAIESLSRTLAKELSPKKIRSNCLKPSFVKGQMVEDTEKIASKELMDKFEEMMPLGFGEPEDVANAAVFLLSDGSAWITGVEISMGGY